VAKDAYLDMYVYDTELSTRFTRKHLGIITVKNDHERIRETVELINIAKAEFKAEVQTIGDEEAKFEAVHKALPGLVTSTAYRSIPIKDNVKAVYFNWAKRARSEKVDTEKLIQQIKDGTGKGAYLSPAKRLRELILLNDHKHRTLRFKRPINVRPECSIRDNQDTLKGTTVGLPIIILADEPVRFTPLGNYDLKTTQASQRSQWKLIIPRLNLYSL
jgi:DNA replication terminus site-binding protein